MHNDEEFGLNMFGNNVFTSQLQDLENRSIFSEYHNRGMAIDLVLYMKLETIPPSKEFPSGDVLVQELYSSQSNEVPGDIYRLAYDDSDEKIWHVWDMENVQKMVGWLMSSKQFMES